MYRIKYWYTGDDKPRWCLSGTMDYNSAAMIIESGLHEKAHIVREGESDED